jgi:uncharacterized protein DUF1573
MLKVDNADKQIGEVKFGQPHTFTYTITNKFTVPVTITKIATGCSSCTKASIDKVNLQPDEVATITAVFTPGSMGLQSKTLTIFSSTGTMIRPPLGLKFRATVSE